MAGGGEGSGDGGVRADVGVFGGSGFYSFLDDVTEVELTTPFGPPAAPVAVGTVGPHRVAFLPRHGRHHELPPHRIDFRANVWALHQLGVRHVFGPCAAGSLQPHIHPGEVVVCDQLVNRTTGRRDTYFDGPQVHHLSFADPYCEGPRRLALDACREEGVRAHDGGTVVVIDGPRFSTRAESRWYREMGGDVINMTQYPESALAAELGLCYATVALVTDYDTGLAGMPGVEPVTMEEVFAAFEESIPRLRAVLLRAIAALPEHPEGPGWDCDRGGPIPQPVP